MKGEHGLGFHIGLEDVQNRGELRHEYKQYGIVEWVLEAGQILIEKPDEYNAEDVFWLVKNRIMLACADSNTNPRIVHKFALMLKSPEKMAKWVESDENIGSDKIRPESKVKNHELAEKVRKADFEEFRKLRDFS